MATHTDRTTQDRSRDQGSFTAGDGGGRRKRGGWLWWLLGLLALAAAVIALIALLGGDDDDQQRAQQAEPTAQATAAPEAAAPATGAGTAGGTGTLTARGDALLPVPGAGLAAYEGESAQGEGVRVQSVVEDEGFWVGSSQQDRVYVEYGGDVGENETNGFVPAVGDRVNLDGPVRAAPEDPAQTLNVPAADAQLVTEQGAYINAENVSRP